MSEFLKEKIETLKEICEKLGYKSKVEYLDKLLERLENPFLITVFGEVNAGKSSFLNALLGIPDLCRTDVDICTDKITVIKYCEKPKREEIDNLTEEVCVNNPLLKGFTVVDTPGINSVLEHHTYITENFLPKSDVILVVLPAFNPHTKPIWDWVSKISKDFGKKLVFILQQKDLLKPQEVERIVNRVKSYARESGVADPKVFAVSALMELKGEGDSGFKELKEFLEKNFTGERQKKLKLEGLKNELIKFAKDCLKKVEELEKEGEELKEKLEEVLALLNRKYKEAQKHKETVLETVDWWINSLTDKVLNRLDELSLLDLALRKKRVKDFLNSLRLDIEEELNKFVKHILAPKLELFEEGVLKPAVEEAARRLSDFNRFLKKLGVKDIPKEESRVLKAFENSIGRIEVGGGEEAIAVVGGSLLAGSLMMLLSGSFAVDITGGVIASIGVLLGIGWVWRKKRELKAKLLEIFRKEIGERLKTQIEREVDKRLEETLLQMIAYLEDRIKTLDKELKELKKDREKLINLIRELRNFNP